MIRERLSFRPPHKLVRVLMVLVAVGGAAALAGLLLEPMRTGAGLLLAGFALVGLSLAGAVFVALLDVTGANWATTLRRVPEAMAAAFPAGAILLAAVLLAGPGLYPWFDPSAGEAENLTPLKEVWLNRPFFLLRSALYLACWYGFILALVGASRRQDAARKDEGGRMKDDSRQDTASSSILPPSSFRGSARLSAAFLVVFGFTFWLASQDWIMSLESEWLGDGTRKPTNWSSTIYGLYNFSGLFLSGLAVLILLVLWLRRVSIFGRVVGKDQLHDLGKLLFAFSTFWMYVWFCQYLLIWYVNEPEETTYLVQRQHGPWQPLLLASLTLNWVIPFVVLLPRAAKQSPGVLAKVCVLVVLGRWLDLYLMIAPAVAGPVPAFGLLEVGVTIGAAALFALAFFRSLSRADLIPLRDSLLVASLRPAGEGHQLGAATSSPGHVEVGADGESGARRGAKTQGTVSGEIRELA
jgi:hypothetical protein